MEAVFGSLREPGPWLALSSGDPCPANVLLSPDGPVLIDFEMAAFRHALLDAAVLRFPFPNCTPWARLPPAVVARAECAYRARLPKGLVDDADAYGRALTPPLAAWCILRLARLRRVDVNDGAAVRRRTQIIRTVEVFLATATAARCLMHLAAWMECLLGVMRKRWPEASVPAPLYPAFDDIDSH